MTDQTIHEIKPGVPQAKPDSPQPEADAATKKLFDEVSPSMVQIKVDDGSGSGFIISKDGDVATDAHVVLGSRHISVITADGKSHQARMTKLDDVRDVAIIHIEDGLPKDAKPVQLGSSKDLKADQSIWGFGHPHSWEPLYVSPGYFRHAETAQNVLDNEGSTAVSHAKKVMDDMTPKEKAEAVAELAKPMLDGSVNIQPGDSGGAVFDSSGKVVALADLSDLNSHSAFTPVETLIALMDEKSPKFQFNYKTVDGQLTLIDISRANGEYRRPFEDNIIVMGDSNKKSAATTQPNESGDIVMQHMDYR